MCKHHDEMAPIIRLWLSTTLLLGSFLLVSGWLAGVGVLGASGRFTLAVSAFAGLLLLMRVWWRKTVRARLEPLSLALSRVDARTRSAETAPKRGDEISTLAGLVHRICSEPEATTTAGSGSERGIPAISPGLRLSGNLRLAADHVESIKVLLEVSQAHQQPIPKAAFQNLELVSKHLRQILTQLSADPRDSDPAGFTPDDDSPASQAPPRPDRPRLSFECHTSPSGR